MASPLPSADQMRGSGHLLARSTPALRRPTSTGEGHHGPQALLEEVPQLPPCSLSWGHRMVQWLPLVGIGYAIWTIADMHLQYSNLVNPTIAEAGLDARIQIEVNVSACLRDCIVSTIGIAYAIFQIVIPEAIAVSFGTALLAGYCFSAAAAEARKTADFYNVEQTRTNPRPRNTAGEETN